MATTVTSIPRPRELHGLLSWLMTTDHKRIGILYTVTGVGYFLVAGVFALLMRAQLAQPNGTVLSNQTYDEVFTMHGTTMIFLVVMPIAVGLGNYMVPLMIGARDMAFPKLNALSYWMFLFGLALPVQQLPLRRTARQGLVQLRPAHGISVLQLAGHDLLGAGDHHARRGLHARLDQFHRHGIRAAGARHDLFPHPALRLDDGGQFLPGGLCLPIADRRRHAAALRPLAWARISSCRARAAAPCSGSICSGSLGIPKSIS